MKQTLINLLPPSVRRGLRRGIYRYATLASQAGQDYWVFGEVFNEKKQGYFVDVGAHDGLNISNTYLLEKRYQWSGLCIEANPTTFLELELNRNVSCLNICLDQQEGEVLFNPDGVMGGIVDQGLDNEQSSVSGAITLKTKTLNSVLAEASAPEVIDYLSMDVEGAEERVLADFDFSAYTFLCISIERPSELIQTLLRDNNYILVKRIPGLDSFYIHQDYAEAYYQNTLEFYRKKRMPFGFR